MMAALRSALEQQVDELELLQSIFSVPGEFQIEDHASFESVSLFLKDLTPGIPGRLNYSLHIPIDAHPTGAFSQALGGTEVEGECSAACALPQQHTVDVFVKLPHG